MRTRPVVRIVLTVLALLAVMAPLPGAAQTADVPHVLVWYGTYGYRHISTPDAVATWEAMAEETGAFTVETTDDPTVLTPEKLAETDVLAWVQSTGKPPFTQEQRDAIIRFAGCGGGNVMYHAAQDANYGWAEYVEMVGGMFDGHPYSGEARLVVEAPEDSIVEPWSGMDGFLHKDEYYKIREMRGVQGIDRPRAFQDTDVLLSLDGDSYPSTAYEHRQPVAWNKTFRGKGRVHVNNMGHEAGTWQMPDFQTSVINAVIWASEVPLDAACFAADTQLPAGPTPPPADPASIGQPCPVPSLTPAAIVLTEDGQRTTMPNGPLGGGTSIGTVYYVLDLSASGAAAADLSLGMEMGPTEDFDLSITTGWGVYAAQQPRGVAEHLDMPTVPHCAVVQVQHVNQGTSTFPNAGTTQPTALLSAAAGLGGQMLTVGVSPNSPPVGHTQLVAASDGPLDISATWSAARSAAVCRCAILASGDDRTSVMASAVAQAATGGPLLLTGSDALSVGARAQLRRHAVQRVTVLGDDQVVAPAVVAELETMGITVDRIAGATPVETAIAINEAFGATGEPILVSASGTDALAAGRAAVLTGRPLLLTTGDQLSPAALTHLTNRGVPAVTVVGGPDAIGDGVLAQLVDAGIHPTRVSGADAAGTAVAVARQVLGADTATDIAGAILVDGHADGTWADAFVAAGAPQPGAIVLTDGLTIPDATAAWLAMTDSNISVTCGVLVDAAACAATVPGSTTPGEQPDGDGAGAVHERTYAPSGGDTYLVYTPPHYQHGSGRQWPLFIMVHGCGTTAEQQMHANEINAQADREDFLVMYPDNGGACWNAINGLPDASTRGAGGDADFVAGMTMDTTSEFDVDANRVYIIGMSSGAFQTSATIAAYPELYAAAGLNAGGGYNMNWSCMGATDDIAPPSAQAAFDQMGERARVIPFISMGGDTDGLGERPVPGGCARIAFRQWMLTHDLVMADSGTTVLQQPTTRFGQEPGGYAWTQESYETSTGCPIGERWIIHGMGHDWPGGRDAPESATFTDPRAPHGGEIAWDFFKQFSLDDDPTTCAGH